MIEAAFRSVLLAAAGVTALVSTRIYVMLLPQSPTYPIVRVQLVSDVPAYPLADGKTNFFRARLQVDAFATTHASARSIGQAIEAAVGGARFTDGDVEIQGVSLLNSTPFYEADELRLYRVQQDYQVIYRALA